MVSTLTLALGRQGSTQSRHAKKTPGTPLPKNHLRPSAPPDFLFAMPGDVMSLPASKSACIPMEWTADNDLRAKKTNTFKSGKLSSSRRLCVRHNCQKGASQKHAATLVLESRPWQPATQLQIQQTPPHLGKRPRHSLRRSAH